MQKSKKSMHQDWVDPDEAPDLSTIEWQEKFASVPVKWGRPSVLNPKKSTTIRLDADVLVALKAGGAGWQTRVNSLLRKELGL